MHAEREHAGARRRGDQAAGGFDAVQLRHGDVHDDHIGLKLFAELHGFAAVAGLADDLHVGLRGKNHVEALPDQHVIVGQKNSDHTSSRGRSFARAARTPRW